MLSLPLRRIAARLTPLVILASLAGHGAVSAQDSPAPPPSSPAVTEDEFKRLTATLPPRATGDVKVWKKHRDAAKKAEKRNDFAEAERLYAAAAREARRFPPPDRRTAESLEDWGRLLISHQKYAQAELIYQDALDLRQKELGSNHVAVAVTMGNLAQACAHDGQYERAAALNERAGSIFAQKLGASHPVVAQTLNTRGTMYLMQDKFSDAERLFKEALEILETPRTQTRITSEGLAQFRSDVSYTDVAGALGNLALVYINQGRYPEAEAAMKRTLTLYQRNVGKDSVAAALALHNLALLYAKQNRLTEAAPLLQQALTIREKKLGREHPLVADTLEVLARLRSAQGRLAESEAFGNRAQAIRQKGGPQPQPSR